MDDHGLSFIPCLIRNYAEKAVTPPHAFAKIFLVTSYDILSKSSLYSCWFYIKLLSAGNKFYHSRSLNQHLFQKSQENIQNYDNYRKMCTMSSVGGQIHACIWKAGSRFQPLTADGSVEKAQLQQSVAICLLQSDLLQSATV